MSCEKDEGEALGVCAVDRGGERGRRALLLESVLEMLAPNGSSRIADLPKNKGVVVFSYFLSLKKLSGTGSGFAMLFSFF